MNGATDCTLEKSETVASSGGVTQRLCQGIRLSGQESLGPGNVWMAGVEHIKAKLASNLWLN